MKIKGVHERELLAFLNRKYDFAVKSVWHVPIGEDSASYICRTGKNRRVFVKVYPPGKRSVNPSGIDVIVNFLYELDKKHGLSNITVPIKNKAGKLVSNYGKFPLVTYEFIEGKYPKRLSKKQIEWLGEFIGKLHSISHNKFKNIKGQTKIDLAWHLNVMKNAKKSGDKHIAPFKEKAELAVKTLSKLRSIEARILNSKRKIIAHTDLHNYNFLVNRTGLYILDWDSTQKALPEKDLMWFCKGAELDKTFEKGYRKYRENFKLDKIALSYYIQRRILSDMFFFADILLTRKMDRKEKSHYIHAVKESSSRLKSNISGIKWR